MAQWRSGRYAVPCSALRAGLAAALACGVFAPAAMGQARERTIFVGHYYTTGSVASMAVNADGSVALAHLTPASEWTQSLALSPNGRWLAAASGTSSATNEPIQIYRVEQDASLSSVYVGVIPDSPLDMEWLADDLLAVTQTGISVSTIGVYRWDSDAGTLTELDRETSGGFNSAIAYAPGSDYFYTQVSSGTGGPRFDRWFIEPDGTITAAGITPTDAYPLAPIFSPAGDMLFAGGGISAGRHAVLAFLVSEDEGGLIPSFGQPFQSPGNSPAYLTVLGDGKTLAVGHGTDATVRTFAIAPDAALTPTGQSFLVQGLQGAIGEIASLNDVVYATDDTSALDGVQGMYALRVGPDGSMTPLGPLVYTGAPRAEGGIAVWNPTTVCPADFDGNSSVNSADISAFLTRWLADVNTGSGYADFDGSGTVNSGDISAFLSAWLAAISGDCG